MTVLDENPHDDNFILSEDDEGRLSRDNIIVASGAGQLQPGTVLGKLTASGKFIPSPATAADGSETAVAVLVGSWIGGGTDAGDTVTPFIDPNEAHFSPLGTPNLFKTFFAPADYIETVNTLGLPRYAKAIPSDNNKSVRLEMQTNPLSLCLRPRALIKGLHH